MSSLPSLSETIKKNGISYVTGGDTAVVKNYSEIPDDGILQIPAEIEGASRKYSVTAIKNSAFLSCVELKELTISGSVCYIEDLAFSNCINLKKVTFEEGDKVLSLSPNNPFKDSPVEELVIGRYINGNSFTQNNKTLKNVTFLDNISNIRQSQFYCSNIETVELKNVTVIENFAFSNCNNLGSINLEKILIIGESAFDNTGITTLELPQSVISIGQKAFRNCNKLQSASILGNPIIEKGIFMQCSALTEVTLSPNISKINEYMFDGNKSLTTLDLSNITEICLNAFQNCTSLTDIKIDRIKYIGAGAFCNTGITQITIGKDLEFLGGSAFKNCTNLMTADLSKCKINTLPAYLLSGCNSLTTVVLPETITTIESSCFSKCKTLVGIKLPNNLTKIGDYCFSNCTELKEIDLTQNGVTKIPTRCFLDCESLSEIRLNVNTDSIESFAFGSCRNLSTIINTNNVKYVGANAFLNTPFLSNVKDGNLIIGSTLYKYNGNYSEDEYIIPEHITCITDEALKGLDFKTIKIGNNVEYIGNDVFTDCKQLVSLTIPQNVICIGNIKGCNNLTSLTIKSSPNILEFGKIEETPIKKLYLGRTLTLDERDFSSLSNLAIGEYVTEIHNVDKCTNLKTLDLEDSDNEIDLRGMYRSNVEDLYMGRNITSPKEYPDRDDYKFCKLSSLSIGPKVTSIPDYFTGEIYDENSKPQLEEIIIPSNVKKIGKHAFEYLRLKSLKKIELNEGLEEIGESAFSECSGLTMQPVRIPSTVKTIGMMAFSGLKCEKLNIPEGVGLIGVMAFYKLETDSLVLPSTAQLSHESFAFSLLKYVDASKIKGLLNSSFIYNSSLERIILPGKLTELCENDFWYCNSLTHIDIPETVTKIGANAIGCTNIGTIVIPKNTILIEGQHFDDQLHIINVTILGDEQSEAITIKGTSNIYYLISNRSIEYETYQDYYDTNNKNTSLCNVLELILLDNCKYVRDKETHTTYLDVPFIYCLSKDNRDLHYDKKKTLAFYALPESKYIADGATEIMHIDTKEFNLFEGKIDFKYTVYGDFSATPVFYLNGVETGLTEVGEYNMAINIEGTSFDGIYPTDVVITVVNFDTSVEDIYADEDNQNTRFYNIRGEKVDKSYKGLVIKVSNRKSMKSVNL